MRSVLFAFALVACASTPSPSRCVAGQVSTCPCSGGGSGSQACGPDGVFGVCSCSDAGIDGGADAAPDTQAPDSSAPAEASVDAAPEASTADVARDAAPPDTSAPADAARCPMGVTGTCGGTRINLQSGVRQPDGTTIHCGACDNTCAAGTICQICACVR